jgi:hypothetical protein
MFTTHYFFMEDMFMRYLLTMALLAGLLTAVTAPARADLPPEFQKGGGKASTASKIVPEKAWTPPTGEVKIPVKQEVNKVSFTLPAFPRGEDKMVVMKFRVRLGAENETKDLEDGWNALLNIKVNGETITGRSTKGSRRVLNRKDDFIRSALPGSEIDPMFYNFPTGGTGLHVTFSGTWDSLNKDILNDRDEMYWYVLDVTDLVAGDKENKLELTNLGTTPTYKPERHLLIDGLQVGYFDRASYDKLVENPTATLSRFKPAVTVKKGEITLEAAAQGGIRVGYKGETYYWKSDFSEPGETIQYNKLHWTPQERGKVNVEATGDDGLTVQLECPSYTLSRQVRIDGQFLRIEETFTNTGSEDVGIIFKNDFISGQPAKVWRLGGVEGASMDNECGQNPTLYLQQAQTGLGMAVKNTVLRNQMESVGGSRTISFSDRSFGLAKGASHTFNWQMYLGGADYFDFLNALRRDWGVNNTTIPGQWSFWDTIKVHKKYLEDEKLLKAWYDRYQVDIFSLAPWFEYYHDPKYWQPREVFKKMAIETRDTLRKTVPNAKCLASLESFLYYAPLSFFKGTVTLKKLEKGERGDFNLVISEEATKIVDQTPWKDSVFRAADGRVEVDCYYAGYKPDPAVNLKVFPTRTNHWQKVFMGMIDYMINDCQLDGIYIDCFNFNLWKKPGQWDGVSVKIDPVTGKIVEKLANLAFITEDARYDWVKYCADRNKLVYINGNPVEESIQSLPMICFLEAEWHFQPFTGQRPDSTYVAKGQLSTPLGLGPRPYRYGDAGKERYAEVIQQCAIAYLRYGMLTCHYVTELPEPGQPGYGEAGVLKYMFPFTPVELHEGWVIGKERIITCVSRKFHWPESAKPVCKRFDKIGVDAEGGFTVEENKNGGWDVTVNLKDWEETAVIMAGE